jgi:hypothetical protein
VQFAPLADAFCTDFEITLIWSRWTGAGVS